MNVILYSNECPKCNVLKSKLDEKNIQYEIFSDVKEMVKMGMRSVPILKVNAETLDFKQACEWINEQ